MAKFIFVRHGQSEANAMSYIADDTPKLSPVGIEQARETARKLMDKKIDTVLCSPLVRAQQTAEIIAGELGIPIKDIKIMPELRERGLGEFEGKPKTHDSIWYYFEAVGDGVESTTSIIERTKTVLAKIKVLATEGKLILVVGHSAAGFYLTQIAAGKTDIEDFDAPTHMQNADYIEVELP